MPINTPTGYLDITNATLRGSKIVTTGYVGIANANPTNHLSIGSNLHINDTHSNVLQISGNINAASVVLGGISIAPTFDLEIITNTGNTTPYTVEFNNTATAFVTTANATIGDTLTASKLVGDGSGISAIQSSNVTDFASNVSRITTLESSRALGSDLDNNSARITNLSSNLSDNSSRITTLESGDISISGDKTFTGEIIFESNIHMNGGNVLVANTVNMTVSDPIIELGSNNLNTNDLGIIMTRHGATNSNIALVYDESDDILRMGYTSNGASNSIISLDSNALSVSVQGALSAASVTTDDYLIHSGDTDTKVGFPLADTFTVTTSNSERLRVDSSGNVGIATTSPGSLLTIESTTGNQMRLNYDADWYNIIERDSAGDLNFLEKAGTSASLENLMTIKTGGNVGIGTSSPKTLTHIGTLSSSSTTNETIPSSNMGVSASFPGSTNLWLSKHSNAQAEDYWGMALGTLYTSGNSYIQTLDKSNSSYYNLLLQPNGGNVGIGTNNPIGKLDVRGAIIAPVVSYAGNQDAPYLVASSPNYTGATTNWGTYGIQHRIKTDSGGTPRITVDDGNGNEVFTIKNGGNVGIGTNSPGVQLHIRGTSPRTLSTANGPSYSDYGQLVITDTTTPATGGVLGNLKIGFDASTGSFGTGFLQCVNPNVYAGPLALNPYGGNVGIGNTSPGSLLSIESTTGNHMRLNYNADWYNVIERDSSGDLNFLEKPGASASLVNHMTIKTGGNVGVGTSTPRAKMQIGKHIPNNSGTNNAFPSSNMGQNANMPSSTHLWIANRFTSTEEDYWGCAMGVIWDGHTYIQSINKKTSSVYNILLNPTGGNVGVRVQTPQGNLHVSDGNTTTNSSYNPSHTPPLYVTGNPNADSSGSEFRHFNQTQGVGIAYNSIYATGGNTNQELNIISRGSSSTYVRNYAVYSDDRLKTNEEYITNATDTLMKLKPQIYDKHEEINVILDNPIREAGLMAQDIYYDAPELRYLVSARNKGIDAGPVNIPQERPFIDDDPTNDPDYSEWGTASAGVAYIQLIPYLIKSNQELKLKNDALEARIAALENA